MNKDQIKTIVEELIKTLPVKVDGIFVVQEGDMAPIVKITSPDAPILIGAKGATFQAISTLAKRIVAAAAERQGLPEPRFFIDINDYRSSMVEGLVNKATILAERARSLKADVELEPMSSYERLIVHERLANANGVKTESIGEGPKRRIIIRYIGE